MTGPFPRIIATRKTGAEPLHSASQPLGPTLADFWAWSGSDLVSNTSRGVVADTAKSLDEEFGPAVAYAELAAAVRAAAEPQ